MASQALDVFSAALDGCQRLQQEFPSDERLRAIMSRLEPWKILLTQQGQPTPTGRRIRLDSRDLRPLNGDLARLVHRASMEASRLGLA